METLEEKKLRGGYYTPQKLADFIANWCIIDKSDTILEPSAGEGRFVQSAKERKKKLGSPNQDDGILAIELIEAEANKIDLPKKNKRISDFFEVYQNELLDGMRFDVLLGNPPFIRYQNFDDISRDIAFSLMKQFGFSPNKLTNIWIPFLLLSIQLLSDNGRIGMVIPAELMQVGYAQEARKYLLEHFDELIIMTFSENVFAGAQQEVVVLLGRKVSEEKGVKLVELKSLSDIEGLNVDESKFEVKHVEPTTEKWLKYFLLENELLNFEQAISNKKLLDISDVIEVNVGVVTGQNEFFVIDKTTVDKFGIQNSTVDIISRSEQIKDLNLSNDDLKNLYSNGKRVKLFYPRERLTKEDQAYIHYGEESDYHSGYKTRIRKEWYRVPLSWEPEAFFLRQVHEYPRIIINKSIATNTDTLHKIRTIGNKKIEDISISFLNSLTLLQCELTGRSYGGGVLTFEPGEVRQLKIPDFVFPDHIVSQVESLISNKKIAEAVTLIDELVLHKHLGYTRKEIMLLQSSWMKLKNRRLSRKK